MQRKVISLLLALVMVLTLLPGNVFAASDDPSGSCGPQATWSFDRSTGQLTIAGSGEMDDYECDMGIDETPWVGFNDEITSVVVGEGITYIGMCAFGGYYYRNALPKLTSVSLPSTLKSIGKAAFRGSSITSISLPSSLQTIGESAFSTTDLTSVVLPDSLRAIDKNAFKDTDLTSITIPASVSSIGYDAFKTNTIQNIAVDPSNQYFAVVDGVLYDKNVTKLICYPPSKQETNYSIPATITEPIYFETFWGYPLKSITVPEGVPVTFTYGMMPPDGTGTDDSWKFIVYYEGEECPSVGFFLTREGNRVEVEYIKAEPKEKETAKILSLSPTSDSGDFYFCDYYNYRGNVFFDITFDKPIASEDGDGDSHRARVNLNAPGAFAIYRSSDDDLVYKAGQITLEDNFSQDAFSKLDGTMLRISISQLYHLLELDTEYYITMGSDFITFEDGVSSPEIKKGEWVFKTVDFPTSGKCGDNAEWNFDVSSGTLTISGTGAIYDYFGFLSTESDYENCAPWASLWAQIKSVVIEEGITDVGDYAFGSGSGQMSMYEWGIVEGTSISLPNSLRTIGISSFGGFGGLLWRNGNAGIDLVIPSGVTSVGERAFVGCGLRSVTVPKTVKYIDESAFRYCNTISDVYFKGTESEWKAIEIDEYNDPLLNANIHYAESDQTAKIRFVSPASGSSDIDIYNGREIVFYIVFDKPIASYEEQPYQANVNLLAPGAFAIYRASDGQLVYRPGRYSGFDFSLNMDKTQLAVRPINIRVLLDPDTTYYITMGSDFVNFENGVKSPEIKAGQWVFKTAEAPAPVETQTPTPDPEPSEEPEKNLEVSVARSSVTLSVGKTANNRVTVSHPDAEITWKSSNSAVATVDASGLVKGVSVGTAEITVTAKRNGKTSTAKYTVTVNPQTKVYFKDSVINIEAGQEVRPAFVAEPSGAIALTSSDESVVKTNGITIIGVADGTATVTITLTAGNETATAQCTVVVTSTAAQRAQQVADAALRLVNKRTGLDYPDAWCGFFIGTCVEQAGFKAITSNYGNSASIASTKNGVLKNGGTVFAYPDNGFYQKWVVVEQVGKEIQRNSFVPQVGDIAVMRNAGHVGIVVSVDGDTVTIVHGNYHCSDTDDGWVCGPNCTVIDQDTGRKCNGNGSKYSLETGRNGWETEKTAESNNGTKLVGFIRPNYQYTSEKNNGKQVVNVKCPIDVQVSYNGEYLDSATDQFDASYGSMKLLDDNGVSYTLDNYFDTDLIINGTGNGTMDISFTYTNDDGTTGTRAFKNVPITEKTTIRVYDSHDPNGTVTLFVFEDEVLKDIWLADSDVVEEEPDDEFKESIERDSILDSEIIGLMSSGDSTLPVLDKNEIAKLLSEASQYNVVPKDIMNTGVNLNADDPGSLTDAAKSALLKYVNAIRQLAGVAPVELSADAVLAAQYAAAISALNGEVSANPKCPDGMSSDFYQAALKACGESVLMKLPIQDIEDYSLSRFIGYQLMNSQGQAGLLSSGILSPTLMEIGIGFATVGADGYFALTCEAGAKETDYNFMAWPASGSFPVSAWGFTRPNMQTAFDANTPWSVYLNPDRYATPEEDALSVKVTRNSDGKTWSFPDAAHQDAFQVSTGDKKQGTTITFSIWDVTELDGTYHVEIEGLHSTDGEETTIDYEVDFFEPALYETERAKWEAAAGTPEFTDVATDSWVYSSTQLTAQLGIMNGVDRNVRVFNADGTVTLGEVITTIVRLYYRDEVKDGIPGEPWYKVYMDVAETHGLVSGIQDPRGDRVANRGEIAMVIFNLIKDKNGCIPDLDTMKLVFSSFADLAEYNSSSNLDQAIGTAVAYGIMIGVGEAFQPEGTFTRGQLAALACNLLYCAPFKAESQVLS